MSINVIWWNADGRGSWSCCHMLNEMFDLYVCTHNLVNDDGAVIVIHGQLPCRPLDWVERLPWVIWVVIGDEASESDYTVKHPNSRLWLQTPLPSQRADRYLIEGYPIHTKQSKEERSLLWFFAGQDNHQRRHDCVKALREMEGGLMLTTHSFGAGIPQDQYLKYMSRALVIPCPSGPATADSFRIWEALECGAVPIIDARSLRDETVGFWSVVLGDHPLPIIEDWETLPEVMLAVLRDYPRISRLTQFWWLKYKLSFRSWLARDLISLGAR